MADRGDRAGVSRLGDVPGVVAGVGLSQAAWDVHAVFVPEMAIDLAAEAQRLSAVMDEVGNVNVFLSEGAGLDAIVAELEASGAEVPRDPFGHVKLDKVNPASGSATSSRRCSALRRLRYSRAATSRSAAANDEDLALIRACTDLAVDAALRGEGGVIGQDEDQGDVLRPIEFPRIRGGKPFDIDQPWFDELLAGIGQQKVREFSTSHMESRSSTPSCGNRALHVDLGRIRRQHQPLDRQRCTSGHWPRPRCVDDSTDHGRVDVHDGVGILGPVSRRDR